MISPWMDLTREHTIVSPNKSTDWLVDHHKESTRTGCVDIYCGDSVQNPADPRVSPLMQEPHELLPRQFLCAGKAEVLYDETYLWAQKCVDKLGQESVDCYFLEGQVHTFAIGGWLADTGIEEISDGRLLSFVSRQIRDQV